MYSKGKQEANIRNTVFCQAAEPKKINKQNKPALTGSLQPCQGKTLLLSLVPPSPFFHAILKKNPLAFSAAFKAEGLAMLLHEQHQVKHEEHSWEERWGVGGRLQTDMLRFPSSFQKGASLPLLWPRSPNDPLFPVTSHRTLKLQSVLLRKQHTGVPVTGTLWQSCLRLLLPPACF